MCQTAAQVLRGRGDAGWLAACPPLAVRDAAGHRLEDWLKAKPEGKPRPKQAALFRKPPAHALDAKTTRPAPNWLAPQRAASPAAGPAPCAAAQALPVTLAGGQLRLRAGADPQDLGTPAPFKRPVVPPTPRPDRSDLPREGRYFQARSPRAVPTAAAQPLPKGRRALPPGMAAAKIAPWSCDLGGPQAPANALRAAAEVAVREGTGRRQDAPDTARPARNNSAPNGPQPAPKPATPEPLHPPIARQGRAPAPSWREPEASNSPRAPTPQREDVHGPDPLETGTISRPPHQTSVPLPPQPDLDLPFAEVLTPESRDRLGRFQEAVADEPLTDSQTHGRGRGTARAPAGFDRDALSDALAQVLRDEARRHGIDV